jgi:lipoate-protein ligase A
MKTFRVIDTGVREGRRQIAFDQAMIDAHKAGRIPDSIRFLRFPPTALVGRHQALSREVKLDYCRSHGIGVVRRITGGGAIYFDEGQLGWELVSTGHAGIASLRNWRDICQTVHAYAPRRPPDTAYATTSRWTAARSAAPRLLRRRHADLPGHRAGTWTAAMVLRCVPRAVRVR